MKHYSKKDKRAVCYLCGADQAMGKLTRDHVFPNGLFPSPKPKNLLTLPCCEPCQKRFSLDEEYFRNRLATSESVFLTTEGEKLWERVLPSYKKTPAKHTEILNNLIDVEVKSSGGIYLGKRKGFRIDKERFDNVLMKILSGLHFYHSGKTANSHEIVVLFDPVNSLNEYLKYIRFGQNLGDVVSYRGAVTDTENSSMWWILFFKSHLVIGIITKK